MDRTHSYSGRGYVSKETFTTDRFAASDRANPRLIPQVYVVCDQKVTPPEWAYILGQEGLTVILEASPDRTIDHWSTEMPDLVVLDVDVAHQDRMELFQKYRAVSLAPILLLLPAYHETQILEAYAAGADELVVKPVNPAVFLAKIMAWLRRSWVMPFDSLKLVKAGMYRLDPARRCLVGPNEAAIKLSDLEFRLLHVLMQHPGHRSDAEEIVRSIWGGYGNSNQVSLKNVVYRLRKKIETDPGHPLLLQTEPGGYSFQG